MKVLVILIVVIAVTAWLMVRNRPASTSTLPGDDRPGGTLPTADPGSASAGPPDDITTVVAEQAPLEPQPEIRETATAPPIEPDPVIEPGPTPTRSSSPARRSRRSR